MRSSPMPATGKIRKDGNRIATEDGKPAVDHAIRVGLCAQNADESYQLVEKKDINITAGNGGSKSVTFEDWSSNKTYYVFGWTRRKQ